MVGARKQSREGGSGGDGHSRRGRSRRADGDATLEKLQRAALALIAREGAPAVTHRAVSEEAGVSLSATTYYFDSKQDMIASAFERLAGDLRTHLDGLVTLYGGAEPGTASREQEVSALGAFVAQRIRAEPGETLTMLELLMAMARDSETRERLTRDRDAIRRLTVELLERSHARHPEEDADLILSLVTGLLIESLVRGRPAAFEERAVRIAERVMGFITSEEP